MTGSVDHPRRACRTMNLSSERGTCQVRRGGFSVTVMLPHTCRRLFQRLKTTVSIVSSNRTARLAAEAKRTGSKQSIW